jgi:glycosyltransferase involved in cell wall biosynthesis
MRIGIDARPLSRRRSGIGNYVQCLVELLPRIAPQHEYFLYSNRPFDLSIPEGVVHERVDRAFGLCPGAFWILGRGSTLIRQDAIDVYWATNAILPPYIPSNVAKVITVYDMVWLRYPETTSRYNLLVQAMCAEKAISRSDFVVTISRSVREELLHSLSVAPAKTGVVYPGISDNYYPQDRSKAAQYVSNKFGVPTQYMACVGTVEPRKNLSILVEALRIVKSKGKCECPLVVAGASGWRTSDLFQRIRSTGLGNDIRFIGYVPARDLPSFYAGAQVFLFPSIYEGFGLPPLEAMACGTPVISSDAHCMPEVLGDAAMLVSPAKPEDWAEAMVRALDDNELRNKMRNAGVVQAAKFQPRASAECLLEILARNGSLKARAPMLRRVDTADPPDIPSKSGNLGRLL